MKLSRRKTGVSSKSISYYKSGWIPSDSEQRDPSVGQQLLFTLCSLFLMGIFNAVGLSVPYCELVI
jgi:hypothetical protein